MGSDPNTPAAAPNAHGQFQRAVRECEKIIERAYSPEINERRWAAEKQQWLVRRRDAEGHVRACKVRGYPELGVTDAFRKLKSLDVRFKIACDYRAAGCRGKALKVLNLQRKRGPKARKFEGAKTAMSDDLQHGRITEVELLRMKEKELAAKYHVSRDTVRKVRNAVLSSVDNSNSDK